MPDWVTHLGAAYLGARMTRMRETQLVLIGAVLPDVAMPVFVVIDLWHLPLSGNALAFLLGFQSLTIVSLLAASIALLHRHPGRCFLLVYGGALTHFALDVLETDIDCGMRIFYPFSYHWWSPGWLSSGSLLSTALLVISALSLGVALRGRTQQTKMAFHVNSKKLCCAAGVAILTLILPGVTQQTVVEQNVHSLAFLGDPAAWEGRTVDLCFSEVIAISPVKIKELDSEFELANVENLRVGDHISVRGVFRDRTIYPIRLYNHRGFSDAWISLMGLGTLILLLIPSKIHAARGSQKNHHQ